MIKVIFPPGCYGTYLSKCIYNYTNLRKGPFSQFIFDSTGSSHDHWSNTESKKYIQSEHVDTFTPTIDTTVVAVLPHAEHNLDYYSNQFYKTENKQLISYLLTNYTSEEISTKLKTHWGIDSLIDDSIPDWILREWCSFWILDCWMSGYDRNRYAEVSSIQIDANDLVESFDTVFLELIDKLDLTLTVDTHIIKQTHVNFYNNQKFHNAQLKCNEWVNCIIDGHSMMLDNSTIFNEAYVQKLLRDKGYEIYCDGLNVFPTLSTEMKELIYKV